MSLALSRALTRLNFSETRRTGLERWWPYRIGRFRGSLVSRVSRKFALAGSKASRAQKLIASSKAEIIRETQRLIGAAETNTIRDIHSTISALPASSQLALARTTREEVADRYAESEKKLVDGL